MNALQFRIRFRNFVWLTAVMLFTAFFLSCSKRPRTNPLDPQNRETGGIPEKPRVVSFLDTVVVQWNPFRFNDITAIRIYRKLVGEAEFTAVSDVAPDQTEYMETGAPYEQPRWYRLSVISDDYETPPSEAVSITPGPSFIWLVNAADGKVSRITHDGQHVIFSAGLFLNPIRVAVNPRTHQAWISDFWSRAVVQLDAKGEPTGLEIIQRDVIDIEIDTTDGSFWMLSRMPVALKHYTADGNLLWSLEQLQKPGAMTLDPIQNVLWLADNRARQLWEIDRNGQRQGVLAGFAHVQDMVIDPLRQTLWIADSTQIVRIVLSDSTYTTVRSELALAKRLALNYRTGECWAVDRSRFRDQSTLYKFSATGQEVLALPGFTDLQAVAVNQFNNHAFVVEGATARLIQISPTGQRISTLQLNGHLIDLTIENLQDN